MNFLKSRLAGVFRARPKYATIGDEVSVEGSICQAAHAIDLAGQMAGKDNDTERMLQVAEYWTKLADFIVALSDHQGKKKLDEKSEFPTGFQAAIQGVEINIEEGEEYVRAEHDRADPSPGSNGVHPEHGEFRITANRRGSRGFRPRG